MDRSILDCLVNDVRVRYHQAKAQQQKPPFMSIVVEVAHRHWMDNPFDKAEFIVRQMIIDEFARIKRRPKIPKCDICGQRAYLKREGYDMCMECETKSNKVLREQLEFEFS